MTTTAEPTRHIIPNMGKKKPVGGKHVTKRVNVGMPEKWHAIARRLSAKKQQPVTYLLIALLQAEAAKQGLNDLPSPPWEEEAESE